MATALAYDGRGLLILILQTYYITYVSALWLVCMYIIDVSLPERRHLRLSMIAFHFRQSFWQRFATLETDSKYMLFLQRLYIDCYYVHRL